MAQLRSHARRLSAAALLALAGCGAPPAGDAARGRELLRQYGCGACHVIPGVAAARGRAGPTLAGIGQRAYLGGVLPNTREGMAAWLRDPRHFNPGTAMPDLGVTPKHAAAMAAYLETLR